MTEEKLREIAIIGKLFKEAEDCLGIYCQSVAGQGGYEKRTEWMEGWNAYGMKLVDNWCELSDWHLKLPAEYKLLVEDLILEDKINLRIKDNNETILVVNCNDLFWWGCADAEEIKLEELPDLIECCKLSPVNGTDLWCARKRGMRPQKPCYNSYSEEERKLFDECGPERGE